MIGIWHRKCWVGIFSFTLLLAVFFVPFGSALGSSPDTSLIILRDSTEK